MGASRSTRNGTAPDVGAINFDAPIPIFPLPNTVLLPRAVLPLHLFEPRYRDMADDVLPGARLVAMALLEPGYEEHYYTHIAAVHPVLCVGYVVRYERLPDRRCNLLLQGVTRAAIVREDQERSYRRGWLKPIPVTNNICPDTERQIRCKLARLLDAAPAFEETPSCALLQQVAGTCDLSLSDALDLLAFNLLPSPEARQVFLEQPDVLTRAEWLAHLLMKLHKPAGANPCVATANRRAARAIFEN